MSLESKPRVRATYCDHRASDEEVYAALKGAILPLDKAWEKLKRAHRITVKFNQAWRPGQVVYLEGQFQELVDPKIARALIRCVEISTMAHANPELAPRETITLMPVLEEFDVPYIDGNEPPHRIYQVPGGGHMFRQYLLPEAAMETDAFISVQKLKSHKFMGVTLCLKNLFGLTPQDPHGRTRAYFHHLIRLPYVLVDLGLLIRPTLNIIDALVGQSGMEWGGEGRICNALIAGDDVFATDACGTYLMGLDPLGDWPDQPFVRERNSLLIAHQAGVGTADLREIDFASEVSVPLAAFSTAETDPFETVLAWRRSTCEQALYYRDHRERFIQYAGEYILLQNNEVLWHSKESEFHRSRRDLAGQDKRAALWLKLVDPDEVEGEHYEVYEKTLESLKRFK